VPGLLLSGLARSAVFAPLEAGGRVGAVVQRLSNSIALGMFRDGEQLPAQQDLAADLGVSLVTLREALSQLQERGLVETRRGHRGGSFVRLNSGVSTARARQRLYRMSSHDLVDLADMQRAVSGQASRLAAARSTPDFVTRLIGHIDLLERTTALGERRCIDGRFLIEVAAASQSVRLTRAEMALQAEVNELRWLVATDGQHDEHDDDAPDVRLRDVVASHRGLVDAIGSGDEELAQSAAETRVADDLTRLLGMHKQMMGV
jgi:DNA-binding FadR family transcriptional regulator